MTLTILEKPTLTQGEALVLSILSEEPNHPYGIEKTIEERRARNWMDLAFSSIYHALDRLEKKGFVSSTYYNPEKQNEKTSKRRQRIFEITLEGRKILREDIAYLISHYVDKSPSTIGFANLLLFEQEEVSQLLEIREEGILDRLKQVSQRQEETRFTAETRSREVNLMVDLLFESAKFRHKAELKFLKLVKDKWLNVKKKKI